MRILQKSVSNHHFWPWGLQYLGHSWCPSWTIPILLVFPKCPKSNFIQDLNCGILQYFQFLKINSCSPAHFWFVYWIHRFIRSLIFRSIFRYFQISFWLMANSCWICPYLVCCNWEIQLNCFVNFYLIGSFSDLQLENFLSFMGPWQNISRGWKVDFSFCFRKFSGNLSFGIVASSLDSASSDSVVFLHWQNLTEAHLAWAKMLDF